ncbi:hypothetical protein ACX27_04135 [Nostoc piscinale CENA21]|uniref:Uncharacterized protein n=1 Tax=Nostoc piscinale CENA21 TaxID=224013 RepID=A0A0M3V4I8_9NOSO|nr:hypothetical protein [Nostoc piscinale]ALF52223.1 hypothetical protein ACX27_04135 [Nostoc piscinale CENA21]
MWQQSTQTPPHWWQLQLGNGLIQVRIKYKSAPDILRWGDNDESGYCVSIGSGINYREKIFPTLSEAKAWGVKEAKLVLRQMRNEISPQINWLFALCLLLLGFIGGVWLAWFQPVANIAVLSIIPWLVRIASGY